MYFTYWYVYNATFPQIIQYLSSTWFNDSLEPYPEYVQLNQFPMLENLGYFQFSTTKNNVVMSNCYAHS
jgi:hypothetical protein